MLRSTPVERTETLEAVPLVSAAPGEACSDYLEMKRDSSSANSGTEDEPDDGVFNDLDKELLGSQGFSLLRPITCWWAKNSKFSRLIELDHFIQRLQEHARANMQITTSSPKSEIFDQQLDILRRMRLEFRNAPPATQAYACIFDESCLLYVSRKFVRKDQESAREDISVQGDDVDSDVGLDAYCRISERYQDLNDSFAKECGFRWTPTLQNVSDLFGVRQAPAIQAQRLPWKLKGQVGVKSEEVDSLFTPKEELACLPVRSIWQIPELWERQFENGYFLRSRMNNRLGQPVETDVSSIIQMAKSQCNLLQNFTQHILEEMLPTFTLKMNQMKAIVMTEVDLGKTTQTKVLAGMTSVLFAVVSYAMSHPDEIKEMAATALSAGPNTSET